MALILKEIYKYYVIYVHEARDTRLEHLPLMGSPIKPLAVTFIYWYFVRTLGPKLMEKREPFNLKTVMMVYNMLQVIANLVLGFLVTHTFFCLETSYLCGVIDYSNTPTAIYKAKITYSYYIMKIMDLLDTVFFILRKKYGQATFLHVYHHCCMIMTGYLFANYMPAGHASLFGILNCFVHTIMYLYYFLSSANPKLTSSVAWKRYITQIQMTQFLILIIHFTHPLLIGNCNYPIAWLVIPAIQSFIMLVLFANFYCQTYIKKVRHATSPPIKTSKSY